MSTPTTVYLAGSLARRDELKAIRDHLQNDWSFVVVSRWLDSHHEDGECTPAYLMQCAQEDLDDIDAADVFVAVMEPDGSPNTRGGRHVEYGYALARDKCLVVCGRRETVFHHFNDGRTEYVEFPELIPFAVSQWHQHIRGSHFFAIAGEAQS